MARSNEEAKPMSDLHRDPSTPKARKAHTCIACGFKIPKGETYTQQEGFFEGRAYRNRYHGECWEKLSIDVVFEFVTGDMLPPERLSVQQIPRIEQ